MKFLMFFLLTGCYSSAQVRADGECTQMIAKGVPVTWEDPMVVLTAHGVYKKKRVDLVRSPGAACAFDFSTHECTCFTENMTTASIMPEIKTIRFNACAVLHSRGEIP